MPKANDLTRDSMTELFIKNAERIRLKHEESQERFANNCDMSRATYTRIITGKRQVDAAYSLLRLCVEYGVHVYDLFELDDDTYRIASKLDKLTPDQQKHIEYLIDYELKRI